MIYFASDGDGEGRADASAPHKRPRRGWLIEFLSTNPVGSVQAGNAADGTINGGGQYCRTNPFPSKSRPDHVQCVLFSLKPRNVDGVRV